MLNVSDRKLYPINLLSFCTKYDIGNECPAQVLMVIRVLLVMRGTGATTVGQVTEAILDVLVAQASRELRENPVNKDTLVTPDMM